MKKFFITYLVCLLAFNMNAQTHPSVNTLKGVQAGLKQKLNTLCTYITDIGTSSKISGSKSAIEKRRIKENYVPNLFYHYDNAPRKMIVTSSRNPKGRKKIMRNYFDNLYQQSLDGVKLPIYKLRLARGYVFGKLSDSKNWTKIEEHVDGLTVYRSSVPIEQEYFLVNSYNVGKEMRYKESEIYSSETKYIYIYLLVNKDHETMTLLGDVYKSIVQ